ncbi:hypothetical protein Tco_1254193 [Tanacetum coccineum]
MAAVNDVPQLVDKKGGSYAAIAPKLEAKSIESLSQAYTRYKTLLNELANDGVKLSKHEINDFQENSNDEVDERSGEEYLRDLDLEYHEITLLTNSKRHFARECFSKTSKPSYQSPVNNYSSVSKCFQLKFTPKLIQSSPNLSSQADPKVKVLMALADDELTVGKSHAHNDEWVSVIIRKVNTLLSMDEDTDWKNYLKYINIGLKFVEEQRLNLLSKYNKMVFELNNCRDELLILKQAKIDAITFQIQNTKLTKLNHALQEQLKEEKKINEKWLTSSKKVSQCISEQITYQKNKVISGELFTESSSKMMKMKIFLFLLPWGMTKKWFQKPMTGLRDSTLTANFQTLILKEF